MELDGHRQITETACKEFLAEIKAGTGSFAHKQLHHYQGTRGGVVETTPASHAVERDIIDVLTTGHWSNFAQKHHFMRRFDGQRPHAAWEDATKWILKNAVKFADNAVRGKGRYHIDAMGYAAHAVEDSFASGHAVRTKPGGATKPGEITHVKMYAGSEKHDHAHHDSTWKNKKGGLSLEGQLAKNAVKALLHLIFSNVSAARAKGQTTLTTLTGWTTYRDTWLKASARLSKERDGAYDLVDDYYNGIVWGNGNHALNFDEEGLAKAIHKKLHIHTRKVTAAFKRLDEYHTVDADDVAHYYVEILRKKPKSATTMAVLKDKATVRILVKVLDEGWTTGGEQKCIDFLQGGS